MNSLLSKVCPALFFSSVWENIGKMRLAKKKKIKILLHRKINSVLSIDFLPFENLNTMYWFRFHLLELGYFYSLYIWEKKKVIDLSERVKKINRPEKSIQEFARIISIQYELT